MIKLSKRTKVDTQSALQRAIKYFVTDSGLKTIETIGHLHSRDDGGFVDIRISGGTITGDRDYDSGDVIAAAVKQFSENYGFRPISYSLHMHTKPDESVGHLTVTISTDKPVEVTLESQELDAFAKEFAGSLPKA